MLHLKRDLKQSKRDVVRSIKGTIKEQRFTNQICSSQTTEKDALVCFNSQDGSSVFVEGIELRHSNCHPSMDKSSTYTPDRMNINLLHTCRQIYDEARFIPYSTNTLSFNTPRNLRAFIHLLNRRSVNLNQAIRSLHIDLAYDNSDDHAWTQALKAVVQHMTLLDRVYVNVDQQTSWPRINVYGHSHMCMQPLLNYFDILGKLSTRSIEIILSDRHLSSKYGGWGSTIREGWAEFRWTMEMKRKLVEKVKLAIQNR